MRLRVADPALALADSRWDKIDTASEVFGVVCVVRERERGGVLGVLCCVADCVSEREGEMGDIDVQPVLMFRGSKKLRKEKEKRSYLSMQKNASHRVRTLRLVGG